MSEYRVITGFLCLLKLVKADSLSRCLIWYRRWTGRFPFLQYEIRCRYSLEQQISYCENKSRKWLPLPDEWFSVISENRRSIGESQRLPKP